MPEDKNTSKPSPAPLPSAPLAYENQDFLNSPDGRTLRILAEYNEPMARFRREAQVLASAKVQNGNTVLTYADHSTITLVGVNVHSLADGGTSIFA